MAVFFVEYRYTDDAEARNEFRAAHREFLNSSGWTLLSGPLTDPAGALLVVKADDADEALTKLEADPFWVNGLIEQRTARSFQPVGGKYAATFAG